MTYTIKCRTNEEIASKLKDINNKIEDLCNSMTRQYSIEHDFYYKDYQKAIVERELLKIFLKLPESKDVLSKNIGKEVSYEEAYKHYVAYYIEQIINMITWDRKNIGIEVRTKFKTLEWLTGGLLETPISIYDKFKEFRLGVNNNER